MEFAWDPAKSARNVSERALDFADVLIGFADVGRKIAQDTRRDYGEVRLNMLAKVNGRVFHITFTERRGTIWIISARKANIREQKRYEET